MIKNYRFATSREHCSELADTHAVIRTGDAQQSVDAVRQRLSDIAFAVVCVDLNLKFYNSLG